ncbi:protein WVD2-like 5 [Vigna unguiculata]|uniref:TPX2 protein n=1 Tax=Vigna unguiculata TaxID=3917 RepID=A0A4D6NWJ7_VIGUN|nr:protein WVD2-like 5 [Vigna unguiculata]QCE16247.1 TPX2 protein [Vigna unguiculata]
MMDPSNLLPANGLEEVYQNGINGKLSNSGMDGIASNDPAVTKITQTEASNGISENFIQYDSIATDYSSKEEIKEGSIDYLGVNNVTISKEEEAEIVEQTEQSKAGKGPVKNKNAKSPSPRGVHGSSIKKNKDGKGEEVASTVSNGTFSSDSIPRQHIKNRSLVDKQARLSKHAGKSSVAPSEASMEKNRPRLSKKGAPDNLNLQGEAESSSPTAEDGKLRRVGMLPNYGFSFKCDERAERRREFYTKLEEKIHAKEVEESNLQAKTKETQEAEIKMLRKSLGFKATPMPSFYQEPPPPRVEFKKMPTTRAKSPKLGRKKNSAVSETEGNTSNSVRQSRLSLDEKVSQTNVTKGVTLVHQKKPQRKSLPPRLTSEKTSSSNRTPSKAVNDDKTSLSNVTTEVTILSISTGEEKVEVVAATEDSNVLLDETNKTLPLIVEPSEANSPAKNGDLAIEEKPQQLTLSQEPIVAEL